MQNDPKAVEAEGTADLENETTRGGSTSPSTHGRARRGTSTSTGSTNLRSSSMRQRELVEDWRSLLKDCHALITSTGLPRQPHS